MHLTAGRIFLLGAVFLSVFSQEAVSSGAITKCAFDSMWVTQCSELGPTLGCWDHAAFDVWGWTRKPRF